MARLSGALFLLAVAAALPLGLLRNEQYLMWAENRRPAAAPPLAQLFGDPKGFVHGIESYVADHIALREALIGAIGTVKWKLGVGANAKVIVGRGGWLFNFCGPCLDDMRGTAAHRPDLVQAWTAALDELRRYAEARGTRMITVVVPRKEAVYRELLPDWVKGSGGHTLVGDFFDAARATRLDVIYPLDELRARKSVGKLYYKYDHHWTALGALAATDMLLRHLHARYGMPLNDRTFDYAAARTTFGPYESLAVLQGIPWLDEPDYRMIPRVEPRSTRAYREAGLGGATESTTDDASLPTLLMYGDSFVRNWGPLLAPHFRRTVFVETEGDAFPKRWIDEEKPDFLIYQRWEHGLGSLPR